MAKEKKTVFIHQPQYKGGPKELTKFIYANLRYPPEALEAGIEGVVFIEYDIDYLGNVKETRVVQSLGHGCDEEACRVVKLLKFDVERNRGIHVLFHQKVKVQFKKPKMLEKAPALQVTMQVSYTITPSAPAPPATQEQKPAPKTYQYTIKF